MIPGALLLLFGIYAWGLEPGTEPEPVTVPREGIRAMTAVDERPAAGLPAVPDARTAVTTTATPASTNAKLGMWLFLSSDCLFFGAFISTFLLYRDRPGRRARRRATCSTSRSRR